MSSYLCDPATAHAEFMVVKNQYEGETDRKAERGALCYQIRQAFPQGEVTVEEANRIGYETAMRWTKGKYQFFVCTHIDKGHIHNHIYYNSTAYDRSRKFRNFIGSTFALRRLSDRVCLEHNLSVIANPKFHSKGRFLHYGQWLGGDQKLSYKEQIRLAIDEALTERPADLPDFLRRMEQAGIEVKRGRGGVTSFRVPGQERATRFRASTLGDGYGPEDVQAVIDGKAPTRKAEPRRGSRPAPQRVNLLIDIQQRMQQGKGAGYERWAKVYNLKQMSETFLFMREHHIESFEDLYEKTDAAVARFNRLNDMIKTAESKMAANLALQKHIQNYAKTGDIYAAYRKSGYSRKYYEDHRAEIMLHKAAKEAFNESGFTKLPTIGELRQEYAGLITQKKEAYKGYREAKREMQDLLKARQNVEQFYGDDLKKEREEARRKSKEL